MASTVTTEYGQQYHDTVYKGNTSDEYYSAKAHIALEKYFNFIPKDSKVLDFGCGMGQNIALLPNAVGYDISEYALEHAKSQGITVAYHMDDVEDGSMDVVFSSHTLEHVPNPKATLQMLRRKLRPNGRLILVLPVEYHGRADFKLDINQHLFCWNFRTINNLLLTTGFRIFSNEYKRGAGYQKLLPIRKFSKSLYAMSTVLMARLFGIKELMVVAGKEED